MFRSVMLAVTTTLLAAPSFAAELKVISAGAVRSVVGGMIDDYSRQTAISSTSPPVRPDCCAIPSHRGSPPI